MGLLSSGLKNLTSRFTAPETEEDDQALAIILIACGVAAGLLEIVEDEIVPVAKDAVCKTLFK